MITILGKGYKALYSKAVHTWPLIPSLLNTEKNPMEDLLLN